MPASESNRARFTDLDETPSEAVINAVASLTGDDPLEMDPLSGAIDPDALDGLFQDGEYGGRPPEVQFSFNGCQVLVRGDGSVMVQQPS